MIRILIDGVKTNKIPRYLYHAAPVESRKIILKRGLIPHSKYVTWGDQNKAKSLKDTPVNNFEQRLYFSTKENNWIFQSLNDEILVDPNKGTVSRKYPNGYDKYRVDTSKFEAEYFIDDRATDSLYIHSAVPANAIELVETNDPVRSVQKYDLKTAGDLYRYSLDRLEKSVKAGGIPDKYLDPLRKELSMYKKFIDKHGEDYVVRNVSRFDKFLKMNYSD